MLGQFFWRSLLIVFALLCASQNCYAVQAKVTRVFDVHSSFESVLDFTAKNREYIFEDTQHRTQVVAIHPTTTTISVRVLRRHVFLTYRANFALYDNYAFLDFKQIGASSRFANGSSFKLELWRIGPNHSRIRVTIWADAGFRWHLYSHRLASAINRQIDTIASRVRYLEGKQAASQEMKREKPSKMLIAESVVYHIINGVGKLIEGEKK